MQEIIQKINVSKIVDPESPMRTAIDRDGVFELAESIKRQGLINPITVRPKNDVYEVVAGHRRFMACKVAGVYEIPCVIKELTDEAAFDIMAAENLERQDVDFIDEALFVGRLIGENTEKIKPVAERLNRSVRWVESRLEILSYPDFFIEPIRSGKLPLGVAHALSLITDEFWQKQYVEQAATSGMSIPQANYLYELWKIGGSPPVGEIVVPAAEGQQYAPQKFAPLCRACNQPAEPPNLQLIYAHFECPEKQEKESAGPASPTTTPERGRAPASPSEEPSAVSG